MSIEHVREFDLQRACEYYEKREIAQSKLLDLFRNEEIVRYVELALGMTDHAGNYSASSIPDAANKILMNCGDDHRRIFDLAKVLYDCPNANELPKVIEEEGVKHLKTAIGSEMAMMLRPKSFWVGNTRTLFAHLLLTLDSPSAAREEWRVSKNSMNSQRWAVMYPLIGESMLQLNKIAIDVAKGKGDTRGRILYLWADAVASDLFRYSV